MSAGLAWKTVPALMRYRVIETLVVGRCKRFLLLSILDSVVQENPPYSPSTPLLFPRFEAYTARKERAFVACCFDVRSVACTNGICQV